MGYKHIAQKTLKKLKKPVAILSKPCYNVCIRNKKYRSFNMIITTITTEESIRNAKIAASKIVAEAKAARLGNNYKVKFHPYCGRYVVMEADHEMPSAGYWES